MHPAQRLSLFRYGSRTNALDEFMRPSGMDSTRDIRTSRGGRLACSTVTPRRERDDRCLSLRRSFSFASIDPNSERSPFSSVSGLFDLAVGPICESPRTGTGRHAHVMTTTDVRPQLDVATDFVQLLHGDVDFGQTLAENAHLRDRRTCNVKDEMRNLQYETLQVQTPTNTIDPATTIFCYKHA